MSTTYTSNYNLGKQEDKNDNFSMDVITENMDKIDAALSSHELDTNNPHDVTKSQIGLSNVDNTSDLDKPISSLTQTALDLKADGTIVTDHNTNTSNPHGVTKLQVGLANVVNIDTTTTANITDTPTKRFVSDAAKDKLTATTKTIIAEITDTIETLNWSATAPYTQNITLSVPGHTITDADYDINIYRVSNVTEATDKLEIEAYSYIDKAVISADNTLTLTAYDYKPLTDINVKIEVVKKW
jgi:hypothetical protein